jgi:hypothetical protein
VSRLRNARRKARNSDPQAYMLHAAAHRGTQIAGALVLFRGMEPKAAGEVALQMGHERHVRSHSVVRKATES